MEYFYTVEIQMGEGNSSYQDILALSEQYGCDGVEEFNLIEKEVDHILGERAYSGGDIPVSIIDEVDSTVSGATSIKFYFSSDGCETNSQNFIKDLKVKYRDLKLTCYRSEVVDWNEEWRKHYSSIKVSNQLSIIPQWEMQGEHKENEIYIYPGMGFGTGDHETTFLCLKLFDSIKSEFSLKGECLDFGCGSGILGIAAEKLTGIKTMYVDVDPSALKNTEQNYDLNFGAGNPKSLLRDQFKSGDKFNLVFANILFHVLVSEKEVILNSMKDDGTLILSGLLKEQKDDILSEYKDLSCNRIEEKGDWIALMFRKN